MQPGDELDDLFPGTGVVERAWASLTPRGDASARYRSDEAQEYFDDASPAAAGGHQGATP
jgi:hypothetical protein